jgi:hypothetical protein
MKLLLSLFAWLLLLKVHPILARLASPPETAESSSSSSLTPEDQIFWDRFLQADSPMMSMGPVTRCNELQESGGQGNFTYSVDLQRSQGVFTVFYNMFVNPDALDIFYDGMNVFSTGGLVSGSRTVSVAYGSANTTSTMVRLELRAPNDGTEWDVSVSCPV